MINLEKQIGPLRLRAWGLIANFIANAIALFGLAKVLGGTGGWPYLIAGGVATIIIILTLATPVSSIDDE